VKQTGAISAAVAVALLGGVLGGCASLEPPAPTKLARASTESHPATQSSGSPVARAQATHEYPGPRPPRQSARGSSSAVQAVAAFARAYINWNAQTVATDMDALAQESVGQARSAMELAAAQTASDYELRRGGIANSGTVEAVAPIPGPAGRYAVVTRERTTATATNAYEGLRPGWHVAIATVVEISPGRWAVSGWQPEG